MRKSQSRQRHAAPAGRGGKNSNSSAPLSTGAKRQKPDTAKPAGLGFLLCRTAHLFSDAHLAEAAGLRHAPTVAEVPSTSAPSVPRILIVDAHAIVRRGIRNLIVGSGDLAVCGEASGAEEALVKVKTLQPDLVVLDVSLPGKSGLILLKEIKARCPGAGILVISRYEEHIYARRALRAGAMGYIMQRETEEKILTAIRRILGGEVYVSDNIAAGALRQFVAEGPHATHSSVDVLTDRELEIFRAIGEGRSLRDIALSLKVSVHTVAAHRGHIISKLGLSGSRKLLQMAAQQAAETWSAPHEPVAPPRRSRR